MKHVGIMTALLAAFGINASAGIPRTIQTQTEHAVEGEVKKVDRAAGKVTIKTADGAEQTFKYTGKSLKTGSHVVVHYVGEGAEQTSLGVEKIGKDAPKVMEGTVVRADKGARTVVVKTQSGAEETLHLTERATVDTGKGVVKGTEYAGAEGAHVTVHYTEAGGQKVVHLVKHIF
jgi:arginine repressor